MSRTTIDFGIDLGTTNSAIAVLEGVQPRIVKNNVDHDITPSAVGYDKKGQVRVGDRAKNMARDNPDDVQFEFKRIMGTPTPLRFETTNQEKRPEELSAEVLKALKADISRVMSEEMQSAVITVPAAFELHQCDATRRAAELAGLQGSPLLQEPVAAALAYGFQIDSEKAYWLVYDFGGGTFDAALIKAEEGLINVVHHGGDNFLGGSEIDWAIIEKLIIPQLCKNHDLPGLARGSKRWALALMRLKQAVEGAKITLSAEDSAELLNYNFEDASGDEVDLEEITLKRSDVIGLAEPIIERSIEIAKKVLSEKNLSASAIQKAILVGGPTKAPYFRDILKARLGIPLDFTQDPLTVVARGAAVFAGTQKVDAKLQKKAASGEFQIELAPSYKPIGHEPDPLIGGRVSGTNGEKVEGFVIELVNTGSQWRSGRIALKTDGTFVANLRAEKGRRNVFNYELFDATGTRQKTVPDHVVYTIGAVVEEQPLINSMGVATANNKVKWFFEKGAGLPLKMTHREFRTDRPVRIGDKESAIVIPIVEGESEAADRNRCVGKVVIDSTMIKRDLPAATEVEITLTMSESRTIIVNVYVPLLDEEFPPFQLTVEKVSANGADLSRLCDAELKRLEELQEKAENTGDHAAQKEVERIQDSPLIAEIKDSVAAAKGDDPAAAEKAQKRLHELQLKLDAVEEIAKWPSLVVETREWLDDLMSVVDRHGTAQQQERAEDLRDEIEDVIREKKTERLQRKFKQVRDLYFQILFEIPAFWVNQFQRMEREKNSMADQSRASRLLDMGRGFLKENNIDGLKTVVRQLWELLPSDKMEAAQRGGLGGTLIH